MENVSVPGDVVADIVSHGKTTMTFSLYSGELSLAVKQEDVDMLRC
jgi:hypothetical protein